MARYRSSVLRRRNVRLTGSAVATGVLLAALAGHAHTQAGGGAGGAMHHAASASSDVALGRQAASSRGWGSGGEWTCLDELWTRESGWSSTAANPTSDARGIAQNINGWSAAYQYGNARQQIAWGLSYISGRYGTPCAAWSHETAIGWY
jgi:hypothetical protein